MMLVMIGVIFGMQYWRMKHQPVEAPKTVQQQSAAQQSQAAPTTAPAAAPLTAQSTSATASTPTVVAQAASTTVVENELYKITFSNRGGEVRSWILKKFKNDSGQPLDLVHQAAAAHFGYPLSLYTYDPTLTATLDNALYLPSATGTLSAPATLSFHYAANGLDVTKTFRFGADYVIHADTVVLRNGAPVRALLSWPAALGDMDDLNNYAGAQIDTSVRGKDEHQSFKKIAGGATLNGPFDFAGTSDQYFAAIFLPDQPDNATLVTLHNQLPAGELQKELTGRLKGKEKTELQLLGTAIGDVSGHNDLRLFVGPKSLEVLKSVKTSSGGNLGPVLDFGFFGPISKWLFLAIHAVHSVLPDAAAPTSAPHNYSWGWAIILFTILIYALLVPMRIKGMQSAVAMQRIQPQLDAIKAKYKNPKATDPKAAEMNAEIMAYQKSQGVSMLGGCIPSLIQLPLLFAFFTMITRVVELRQAHFFWLPDLSLADPWHILPITMVATSFLVQYMTPSPGVDPQQQKMMAFMMPLFSGYWTWSYASGLALYWNVGNLVMLIQQLVMNQTSLGREMRELAAKRARKRVLKPTPGGQPMPPRTIQGRR
jgi:YidC/Oxa1 family membrane protein insertase